MASKFKGFQPHNSVKFSNNVNLKASGLRPYLMIMFGLNTNRCGCDCWVDSFLRHVSTITTIKTEVYSARSSLAVNHLSTNRDPRDLASVIEPLRALVATEDLALQP
jgi:hypothetical protein